MIHMTCGCFIQISNYFPSWYKSFNPRLTLMVPYLTALLECSKADYTSCHQIRTSAEDAVETDTG